MEPSEEMEAASEDEPENEAEFVNAEAQEDSAEEEVPSEIDDAEASELRDLGNVMKLLKKQLKGKADMGEISGKVKEKLSR